MVESSLFVGACSSNLVICDTLMVFGQALGLSFMPGRSKSWALLVQMQLKVVTSLGRA